MVVDMNLLKQLRDTTFAPMKDCKEALDNSGGDLDAAIEFLKKKGALQAAKKADRETNEGVIKTLVKDNTVYAVKVVCETDFTSGNDLFKALVQDLLETISTLTSDIQGVENLPTEITEKCDALIQSFVGKMGENTRLADVYIHTAPSKVYVYSHPGDKLVAFLYYTPTGDNADMIAKQAALQIAAMNPEYLSTDTIPAEQKDALKAQFAEEVAASGKPAEIVEKIVAGKLDKAFAENVLLEQSAIWDDSKKVKDFANGQAEFTSFVRMAI
jgi:elongation factor Ts